MKQEYGPRKRSVVYEKGVWSMKKYVVTFLLVVSMLFGAGLVFAGGQQESDNGTTPSTEFLIGYSFPTKNNEFWVKTVKLYKDAATQLGVKTLAQDCDDKQDKQVSDVDNLIAAGIDGLVLAPADASVCPGIIQKCAEKNIPLVICDRWPGDEFVPGTDYLAFIGPNDQKAGYDIAMSLINAGCKEIVGLGGLPGTSVGEGRKRGLMQAITENPDKVELLQFEAISGETMDKADVIFRNLLQAHPDIDGVWCFNDSFALAAVNVLKEKNKLDKVKVGGMDLLDNVAQSIKNGEQYFSTGGHWMMAAFGEIMVFDALNGKMPTTANVQLDLLGVDQSTVDKYIKKYLETEGAIDYTSMSQVDNPGVQTYFELTLD